MNTQIDAEKEKMAVRAQLIDDELKMLRRAIARLKMRQAKLRSIRLTALDHE